MAAVNDLETVRAEMPKDRLGESMQVMPAASTQQITLATTAEKREVAVPPDAGTVTIFGYNSDGSTATAVNFGGARAGCPATLAPVANGASVGVAGAPAIYLQAITAGDLITLVWNRKEIV